MNNPRVARGWVPNPLAYLHPRKNESALAK